MPGLQDASTCLGMNQMHCLWKNSLISLPWIGFLRVLVLNHKCADDLYHIACRSGR